MSLSRESFDEIMRVLSLRRQDALNESYRRQEELARELPAFSRLNAEISELAGEETAARLRHDVSLAEELKKKRSEAEKEKTALIVAAGYPADYGGIRYSCEHCHDTGFLVSREKCGCLKKLESEMLARASGIAPLIARENFSYFDMGVFDDTELIKDLEPRKLTQAAYMESVVLPLTERFLADFGHGHEANILMYGPAGTGKTFLANCIASELIERQFSVLYERAGEMFALMTKAAFSRTVVPEAESLEMRLRDSDFLILDDLGTEFTTDYTRGRLFSLISSRITDGKSTLITTNMSLTQLRQTYAERVSSRFIGDYLIIPFYGADIRTLK